MLLFTTQQPGQNAFQITLGDGILPCMSRDLQNDMHSKSALFMEMCIRDRYNKVRNQERRYSLMKKLINYLQEVMDFYAVYFNHTYRF